MHEYSHSSIFLNIKRTDVSPLYLVRSYEKFISYPVYVAMSAGPLIGNSLS